MAQHPMFPLWTDAYLGDTTHLTTTEHGAYLLLLITMWRTADKKLPNDDRLLARYARLSSGQWKRIKPVLMPFFKVQGDRIWQPRLTDEANAVRQLSKRQSDRAKARWLKEKETADAAEVPDECLPTLPTSVSKDTGAQAPPPDVKKAVYETGKAILGSKAGGAITKAIAAVNVGGVAEILDHMRKEQPLEPMPYFQRCVQQRVTANVGPPKPKRPNAMDPNFDMHDYGYGGLSE